MLKVSPAFLTFLLVLFLSCHCICGQEEERQTGRVRWWNDAKGWGYITPEDGAKDIYVHVSDLVDNPFNDLTEGQKVSYKVEDVGKGPYASDVRAI